MAEPSAHRRLAAILSADVAGYTRLIEEDEEKTHEAYKSHRYKVFEEQLASHHGRIVKGTGDGILAEFDSAVEAVEYAVTVQEEMALRNESVPKDRQLLFRIGINVGDIIVEPDDIYGDSVNVAVRIEGLAVPGGICISGSVYDQVYKKLSHNIQDLGLQRVKNLSEPVRTYSVTSATGKARRSPLLLRRLRRRIGSIAVVFLLLALGVDAMLWRLDLGPSLFQTIFSSDEVAPLKLPNKPSIAVLAFDNWPRDAAKDYFGDGITEDIITDLSKVAGLFVVARHSSFAYKNRIVKIQTIGRELGVRYVLEGSIRRDKDRLRINTQLVDARTGGHLWAKRFDKVVALNDVFGLQDEITRRIVTELSIKLTAQEEQRIGEPETNNFEAYDAFLQGWWHYRLLTAGDFAKARDYFDQAINLDPNYARAYAALAALYNDAMIHRWFSELDVRSRAEMKALAAANLEKSIKIRPTSLAHRVKARTLYLKGRDERDDPARRQRFYDEAVAEAREAVMLDPNDAESFGRLGITLIWTGNASAALREINKAKRLNPLSPTGYLAYLGEAEFVLENYDKAVEFLQRSHRRNPKNHLPLIHLVAAYGHLGATINSAATLKVLDRLRGERGWSKYHVELAKDHMPYQKLIDLNRLLVGLRKAGVPESVEY